MIILKKKFCFATLVFISVALVSGLAQSQICTDCAGSDVGLQVSEVGSQYAEIASEHTEIGEAGGYFEQATTCGCEQSGCKCGQRIAKLRSISRALRPFGNSCGYETYRSVFGGWSELEDEGGNDFLDGLDFNDGFILGTAKGIYLNDNLRVERESSWRNNSVASVNSGGIAFPLSGRMNNFSTMVNVIRDFRTDYRLQPYVGLGLGASRQDGEFSVDGLGIDLDADDWALAYQGIVGLKYVKSCRVSLFAEYRYFGNTETDLDISSVGGPRSFLSDFEYTAQNVLFGIQFKR